MNDCELRSVNGVAERPCETGACIFWRALSHLSPQEGAGCAIRHFGMLEDSAVAEWLLTVKARYERAVAD